MTEEIKQEMPAGAEPLDNDQHERFCQEYLKDLNKKQSAIRAGFSPTSACQHGFVVFNRPEVKARIDFLKSERAKELHIEQVDVLARLWAVATADPRELVKHKVVNCRFCWGVDHQYQWVDEIEFENAMQQAIAEEKAIQQDMPEYQATYPTDDGGYGFRRTKPPHPECIKCDGEGKGYIHIEDTSTLSDPAQLLYAGAKQTKEGVEIKMNDQMAALKLVGQHIGMFKDKLEITGANGKDLMPPTFNIIGVKPNGDRE
ncbi:terminase small subunit [Acinetobacter piscicola]|uniref:terminase small subunit n=1 Tax=Acinetobacter piscicola TaxID=2006115 RepID=UPI00102042B8|nr:terminase small subunit [Acinetobacter piscicola]RYL25100.1 terminase small subunit [Acinetobacter piscicola]